MAWAVVGVLALLLKAVASLGGRGLDTLREGLGPVEMGVLVALLLLFVLGEGVMALQRKWVPHVVGRARALRRDGSRTHALLAPLYAMSLVGAPRRALLRAWAGVLAIVAAVLVVRAFPEPWRGIVDLSVAAALAWGSIALVTQAIGAVATAPADAPVPGPGLPPADRP